MFRLMLSFILKTTVIFFLVFPFSSFAEQDGCLFAFGYQEVLIEFLFDKLVFIKDDKGQNGYLKFVGSLGKKVGIDPIFNSKLLNKKEKKSLSCFIKRRIYRDMRTQFSDLI